MTIALAAIAALAAVRAYTNSQAHDAEQTGAKVTGIRRSVAVVLAIGEAIWAVLDALTSLTKPRSSGGNNQPLRQSGPSFGTRIAADVEG